MVSMLRKNATLRLLELGSNTLGDVGLQYIAQGMCHNTTVEKLGLASCGGGREGTESLTTKIKHLQMIDICNVPGREAIFKSVKAANEARKLHGIVELKTMN